MLIGDLLRDKLYRIFDVIEGLNDATRLCVFRNRSSTFQWGSGALVTNNDCTSMADLKNRISSIMGR